MPDLNYNHLRYFRAVAHDGNLTRTARQLNLSQSALSVQIRKLEERLGHALFERRGRQLHLTEAGQIALDHADTIFAAGKDLLATLGGRDHPRRVLRIGALATLSRNFQIEFLRPLLGKADVELVLRAGASGELMQALEALDLDVVLTNRAPASDAMTTFLSHRVSEQPVSLIATPERIGQCADVATLLRAHPVILPARDSSARSGFDAFCARLDVHPVIAAEVDDMAMMRLLAREDIGLAVLPPIVVRDELASGLLIETDRLAGLTEAFYAVTVRRRFPNALLPELLTAPAETAAPE